MDGDPAFAREALGAIEESARAALEDLDHVLGLLRENASRTAPHRTAPQPTLADLAGLLEQTRIAGVKLDSEVGAEVEHVPAAVSREAYRIVQEGLTNALRHAGKVPVRLRIAIAGERRDGDEQPARRAPGGRDPPRRGAREPPRIIVVTTFENDEYVYDALKAGANGFLLKRTRPEEILQAIRMVAHGDSLLFPAAIRALAAEHAASAGAGPAARWHGKLTEREADVLRLMARGRSNAEIAAELFVSPQTVKTHVGNVLGKLQARDRTQAVILAYETGFIVPG